jgi:hypothetical protein
MDNSLVLREALPQRLRHLLLHHRLFLVKACLDFILATLKGGVGYSVVAPFHPLPAPFYPP